MSLIVGLNLSDRVYLGADTRVTDHATGRYWDKLFKIAPLYPSKVLSQMGFKDSIYVAIAGNINMARYFYLSIRNGLELGELPYDARLLFNALNDDWCNRVQWSWNQVSNIDEASCHLIIAGTSSENTKPLSRNTLDKLLKIHLDTSDKRPIKLYNNLPYVVDMTGQMPVIPDHLSKFYLNKKMNEIAMPDTFVFRLDIRISREYLKGFKVLRDSVEKGGFLARGDSHISERTISRNSIVAECELMYNRDDRNSARVIAELIRSHFSEITIGGPVTVHSITKEKSIPLWDAEEIKLTNGKVILTDEKGSSEQRISFVNYEGQDASVKFEA